MGLVWVRWIVDTSRVWGSNLHLPAEFFSPGRIEIGLLLVKAKNVVSHSNNTSVYDPTCGSGSLLLKVGDEARHHREVKVSLLWPGKR